MHPTTIEQFLRHIMETLDRNSEQLDAIQRQLHIIGFLERIIMKELDDLKDDVTANTDVGTSLTTLITTLVALYEAAKADPAKIAAISAQVRANTAAWTAAVLANTPAAPAGTPTA